MRRDSCDVVIVGAGIAGGALATALALVGDAAGASDPQTGQGLAVALRDVRLLSTLLVAHDDWSPAALAAYADERAERMRRLRACTRLIFTFRGEFGGLARERRRRAGLRMAREPQLGLPRTALLAGPDTVPAAAFADSIHERLFAAA
jgi:2-polyprenyl-6-methoxyphenol hydroxylase-like FAD-dependent oxidoreductase